MFWFRSSKSNIFATENYRPEIDGLRAVAVLPVILFHSGWTLFSGGYVGVDIFFVISGYLITTILLRDKLDNTFSISKFYMRRARRILPLLFTVMTVCILAAWFLMLPWELKNFSQSLISTTLFSSNILFWQEVGYFQMGTELKPLLHTWSLAIEEQFYLFFPFVFIFFGYAKRTRLLLAIIPICLLSLLVSEWGSVYHPTANFWLIPSRIWELLMGAICAIVLSKWELKENNVIALLGLVFIVISIVLFNESTRWPSLYTLLPVVGSSMVILFSGKSTYVSRLLSIRVLVGIGLLSYSAYLWHQPLFAFGKLYSEIYSVKLLMPTMMVIIFPLSYFSWKVIERPFRSPKSALYNPRICVPVLVIWGLCIIGLGIAGIVTNGAEKRYSGHDKYLASLDEDQYVRYVTENSINLKLSEYRDQSLKNILIIGDSYAQDVVNAMYESGLSNHFNISTFHIRPSCNNLYFSRNAIDGVASQEIHCLPETVSDNLKLQDLIGESDLILWAAHWQLWETDLIPASVNVMKDFGAKEVLVIGTKYFGDQGGINYRQLLSLEYDTRLDMSFDFPEYELVVNEIMKNQQNYLFYDLHPLFCDVGNQCRIFDDEGKLYSFDGSHLTPDGARHLGIGLSSNRQISGLID